MKICKTIFPFIFLITMVGFEVLSDLVILQDIEMAENIDAEDLTEKYKGEKESENMEDSRSELQITFHSLQSQAFIREKIKSNIIVAHDINYLLLEQKVIIPPPEFCLS